MATSVTASSELVVERETELLPDLIAEDIT